MALPYRKIPRKVPHPDPVVVPYFDLEHEISLPSCTHVATVCDGVLSCFRCRSSFKVSDPYVKLFLKATCAAIGTSVDCPTLLAFEQCHMGDHNTHPSHKLFTYRGLVYCDLCGNVASEQLHKLSKVCLRHPNTYGRTNLAALRQGKLPGQLNRNGHWPADSW